jgi:hypothetical protein
MRGIFPSVVLLLALCSAAGVLAAEPDWEGQTAAFFGVTLLDTSQDGPRSDAATPESARIALIEDYIRAALEEKGVVLVDLEPVSEELARTVNPSDCNDCDLRMARRLGARYSVISEVQKVSNLILSMNLYVRDAESGAYLRGLAVDIRSNTDESWLRGIRYILNNAVFRED